MISSSITAPPVHVSQHVCQGFDRCHLPVYAVRAPFSFTVQAVPVIFQHPGILPAGHFYVCFYFCSMFFHWSLLSADSLLSHFCHIPCNCAHFMHTVHIFCLYLLFLVVSCPVTVSLFPLYPEQDISPVWLSGQFVLSLADALFIDVPAFRRSDLLFPGLALHDPPFRLDPG